MTWDHTGPSWQGKRGTRHERGYGAKWDKLRLQILKRDSYLCQECLRNGRLSPLAVKPSDHAVDHIKPKAQGGTDNPDNLESLCTACHDAKTALEAKQGQGVKPRPTYGVDGWPVWD